MLTVFALLLSVARVDLYSGPAPEPIATFQDWIVGCDNERNCTAIGLTQLEGNEPAEFLPIVVEQAIDGPRTLKITIAPRQRALEEGTRALYIDGARHSLPALVEDKYVITGRRARSLLNKLKDAQRASIYSDKGGELAAASLAGFAASLLRIDDQQGRAGTREALYRPESKTAPVSRPGYSVSVPQAAWSERAPFTPSPQSVHEWYQKDGCTTDVTIPDPTPVLVRLDSDATMAILPWRCQNGSYNYFAHIMIIDGFGEWRPAEFDYRSEADGDRPANVMINPMWRKLDHMLESNIRNRAANDCGRTDRYVWDGGKFRLVAQYLMPECRGSVDRIRVWKADVVAR